MSTHITAETVRRLYRRELPPDDLARASGHIATCADCQSVALAELGPDVHAMTAALDPVQEGEHLEETAIARYIDGHAPAAEREIVESHLDGCSSCRGETDDLLALRPFYDSVAAQRPSNPWTRVSRFVVAAAIAAAAMIAVVFLLREPAPRPAPAGTPAVTVSTTTTTSPQDFDEQLDPRWALLVDRAVRSGRLPYPADLSAIQGTPTVLRGDPYAAAVSLRPVGVVIDDDTPLFEWSPSANASYSVSLFDGDREIARSPVLSSPRWQIERPLRRGRTYTWQVEIAKNGETELLPPPADALARFRVTTDSNHEALRTARERHPDEHLLHAVLYAEAGMVAEAEHALKLAKSSGDPAAKRVAPRNRR